MRRKTFQSHVFQLGFAEATVIAKKTAKTVKCAIKKKVRHKVYGTVKTTTTKLLVHDELDECVPGDRVLLKQSRPHSKRKHWIIYDITKKYKPAVFLRQHPEYIPEHTKEPWGLIPELQYNNEPIPFYREALRSRPVTDAKTTKPKKDRKVKKQKKKK